ncbi:MAG TPA: hypothetical protein PLC47_06765, partial [Bacteroidales bacterium]|nr:hypothetical protein [Bacteroidales bacterium]
PGSDNKQLLMFSSNAISTNIYMFNLDSEVVTLNKTITNFQFNSPVFHQNGNFYLHNDEVIKLWSLNSNNITDLLADQNIDGVIASGSGQFVYYLDNEMLKIFRLDFSGISYIYGFDYPLSMMTTVSK